MMTIEKAVLFSASVEMKNSFFVSENKFINLSLTDC